MQNDNNKYKLKEMNFQKRDSNEASGQNYKKIMLKFSSRNSTATNGTAAFNSI